MKTPIHAYEWNIMMFGQIEMGARSNVFEQKSPDNYYQQRKPKSN